VFHGEQYGSCVGVCLGFVRSRQHLSDPLAFCSPVQLVSNVVRHGALYEYLEQRAFLYDTYVKYISAAKCRQNFRRKFHNERVPSRQIIHNLMNKRKTTGLLIDSRQKHKPRVLTEEKLDDIGARYEHTPRKSLKRLAEETGGSKSSARATTQLLKPSSESWCLVCCKCKRDCCTCVFFNETVNCEKYLRVQMTAFSTPPVICEL
jgi:hypothetical protein